MKSEILKIVILFMMLSILLAILSYSTELSTAISYEDEEYYYLTFHTRDDWQIWKIALDGSSEELIYSLPGSGVIDESPGSDLLDQEIGDQLRDRIVEDSMSRIFVSEVECDVSPDGKYIAIRELFVTFPEGGYDGQSTISILDATSLQEIFHYSTRGFAGRFEWSQDMKYFAFEEKSFGSGLENTRINIYEIQDSKIITSIAGSDGEFIGNEVKVVTKIYPENDEDFEPKNNCCQVVDIANDRISFRTLPERIRYIPYTPFSISNNGEQIAVIGLTKLKTGTMAEEIKILKLRNFRYLQRIPLYHEIVINPDIKWSYRDEYVAIKCNDFIPKVKVTELSTGFSTFVGYRISDYAWSESANRLLYLKSDEDADACVQDHAEIYVLDMTNNERTQLRIPTLLQKYMEENARSQECTEFITEVDW